jgi:hypothetical protein
MRWDIKFWRPQNSADRAGWARYRSLQIWLDLVFRSTLHLAWNISFVLQGARNARARAIALRMHRANRAALPEGIPWVAWLSEATSAGSRIAAEDLRSLDNSQYQVSIKTFGRKYDGRISQHVDAEILHLLITLFPIQEPTKYAQAITEWIAHNKPKLPFN